MSQFVITQSKIMFLIYILVSFLVIYVLAKISTHIACNVANKIFPFSRYFRIQKWTLPIVFFVFGTEVLFLTRNIETVFRVNKSIVADWASSLMTIAIGLLIYHLLQGFLNYLYKRHSILEKNNLQQRKIVTQLSYIDKIATVLLFMIILGAILLKFENLEKIGGSLLASAGIASVVIGFAAQESVSNLLAGFQIAFSQPLRIDDVVVVEGEWGVIEEIRLTYVVVRIWDKRRLVLPIRYFISQPFQNWTRTSAQVIGTIYIHVDYRASISMLREAYEKIVEQNSKWDRDVRVLQVVDATEKTIQLRGLVSAEDSAILWDLRCEVREEMVAYIQNYCPEVLPVERNLVQIKNDQKNNQKNSSAEF